MTVKIVSTDSKRTEFIELTRLLDADLTERYGQLQKQYDRYNKLDNINNVIVIYIDKIAAGCGAFKEFDEESAELKRIFVKKEYRKQGLAKLIVNKLEEMIKDKGYKYAVLETGIKQYEAIGCYKSRGYTIIQNYGPYIGDANSVCMKKNL